jgi:signal transduction histidine kinase
MSGFISRKLNAGLDYRIILDDIFDFLEVIIPFDRISIALLENDEQDVNLKWMKSKREAHNLLLGFHAKLAGSSLESLASTRQPRIINNLNRYLEHNPQSLSTRKVLADGIISSLTFPLISEGVVVGFAFFSSVTPDTYNETHVKLFAGIVDELSTLVHYGKLHDFHQAHKSSEQIVRTTLHELKSPIAIIQGYLDLMRDEPWYEQLDRDSRSLFEVLRRNTETMLSLVSELAESNRTKDDTDALDLKPIDLAEFLSEITKDAVVLSNSKKIAFDTDFSDKLPKHWTFDRSRIKQVVDNLVTNAIKFSNPGTNIRFSAYSDDGKIYFSMADTGPGIPSMEMPKLFQDFGKTSVRPTAGESSSGLGLAISKRIVEKHGGKISAQSQVGKGSTFAFFLV